MRPELAHPGVGGESRTGTGLAVNRLMRSRVFDAVLIMAVAFTGCGFESRVEGTWEPVALEPEQLARSGVPAPMAKTLASSTFVAADGVVYVGLEHEQATLARYRILSEEGDCAAVRLDAAAPESGGPESVEVEACLDDDTLTLRYGAKGKPLAVTFRRGP